MFSSSWLLRVGWGRGVKLCKCGSRISLLQGAPYTSLAWILPNSSQHITLSPIQSMHIFSLQRPQLWASINLLEQGVEDRWFLRWLSRVRDHGYLVDWQHAEFMVCEERARRDSVLPASLFQLGREWSALPRSSRRGYPRRAPSASKNCNPNPYLINKYTLYTVNMYTVYILTMYTLHCISTVHCLYTLCIVHLLCYTIYYCMYTLC